MPGLIRHPACFFLDYGFRRNDGMRGKLRGIAPEVNKKAGYTKHTNSLLPLLPSGPGGVRKSSVVRDPAIFFSKKSLKKVAEREGFEPSVRF
jgi:hypothetical protein